MRSAKQGRPSRPSSCFATGACWPLKVFFLDPSLLVSLIFLLLRLMLISSPGSFRILVTIAKLRSRRPKILRGYPSLMVFFASHSRGTLFRNEPDLKREWWTKAIEPIFVDMLGMHMAGCMLTI